MKNVLLVSAGLAFATASPIEAPAPTPTTTPATTTTITTEMTSTTAPSIDNLCMGQGGAKVTGGVGGILDLGKLEECAGNTLSDKPLGGVLGGVGGILGSG